MIEVNSRRTRLIQDTVKSSLAAAVHQQDGLGSDEFKNTVKEYTESIKSAESQKDLAHTNNVLMLEIIKELRQQRQLLAFMLQTQAASHMQRIGTMDNTESYGPNPKPVEKSPAQRHISDICEEIDYEHKKHTPNGV